MTFRDHDWYSQADMLAIEQTELSEVSMIVTTEKDIVKMVPSEKLAEKLYALRIETKWLGARPVVIDELTAKVMGRRRA